MTQTNTHTGRKTWGFLLFSLGCIIAISGGAKLHPQDSLMRTRALLLHAAHQQVTQALSTATPQTQLSLTAAHIASLPPQQVQVLLQQTYSHMLRSAATTLRIQHPSAVTSTLSSSDIQLFLRIWTQHTPPPISPSSKTPITRKVLATVIQNMTQPPTPKTPAKNTHPTKTPASRTPSPSLAKLIIPSHIQNITGILRDRVVTHLSPYLLWSAIQQSSSQQMSQLAHATSIQSVAPLARLGLQSRSAQETHSGIVRELESMGHSIGKQLRLASADYSYQIPPSYLRAWVKLLQPPQNREQSLHAARIIAHAGAEQFAEHFAKKLTEQTALPLRLVWKKTTTAPNSPSSSQPLQKPKFPQPSATIATSQPTSLPHNSTPQSSARLPSGHTVSAQYRAQQHLTLEGIQERIGGWPDSMPIFMFGVLLALAGLGLWRRSINIENATTSEPSAHDQTNPFALLTAIQAPLQQLEQERHTLQASQLCERVDELLVRYVTPITESRETVIHRLGMEAGAEILVIIAYAERMLNRVWSAASDDHLPEAHSSLADAVQAFREAHQKTQDKLNPPSSTQS